MKAEALNCPNCGGAVTSDKTQCQYCKSRLKTQACPACLSVMFVGSKFCGACGARAVFTEIIDENAGTCPRCKIDLSVVRIDTTRIRECGKCGGIWTSVDAFERLCADQEQQAAVLSFIGSKPKTGANPVAISYVPCPDCSQLMNRSNFARSSGVIIDLCKKHGVWFDADELPKIIEFINSGGMARSREKEKIAIEDERSRLRDEQRKLAMMERRSGKAGFSNADDESGIGSFVSFLFD